MFDIESEMVYQFWWPTGSEQVFVESVGDGLIKGGVVLVRELGGHKYGILTKKGVPIQLRESDLTGVKIIGAPDDFYKVQEPPTERGTNA